MCLLTPIDIDNLIEELYSLKIQDENQKMCYAISWINKDTISSNNLDIVWDKLDAKLTPSVYIFDRHFLFHGRNPSLVNKERYTIQWTTPYSCIFEYVYYINGETKPNGAQVEIKHEKTINIKYNSSGYLLEYTDDRGNEWYYRWGVPCPYLDEQFPNNILQQNFLLFNLFNKQTTNSQGYGKIFQVSNSN